MQYVSAQWVENPGEPPAIKAIGDDGVEYWIPAWNTDVPPWPEYLAEGGTITPVDPNAAVNQQILEVPDTLTGGPTIEEVFNGNV